MRNWFVRTIGDAKTLQEVEERITSGLKQLREQSEGLAYVPGIITSDGPKRIDENIARLRKITQKIRNTLNYPVFSACDVFSDELFERINANKIPGNRWIEFWDAILIKSGVTTVFMTSRWTKSTGAKAEYRTAVRLGLDIVFWQNAEQPKP